ncbi:putative leader peptide [Kitasatospora sp. NPDC057015]
MVRRMFSTLLVARLHIDLRRVASATCPGSCCNH